jgi:cytochrome P450
MSRMALKDFTFSDGTHIPKGAMVSAAARARHHDDSVYTNGDTFDGFRFSDIRDQDGQGTKNQFVATNPDYIPFGHGRHAWCVSGLITRQQLVGADVLVVIPIAPAASSPPTS